jgi:nicotinamide-nucleotide amidase
MALSAELLALGEQVGARLKERGETVAVAESSSGGLISAAFLAVPGASGFYRGGTVVYWGDNKTAFLRLDPAALTEPRASTEGHARVLARAVREVLNATWGIGETGAAGPTGNRYGDPAGHCCVAVVGPLEQSATVETGQSDRVANMEAFAIGALRLLLATLPETK